MNTTPPIKYLSPAAEAGLVITPAPRLRQQNSPTIRRLVAQAKKSTAARLNARFGPFRHSLGEQPSAWMRLETARAIRRDRNGVYGAPGLAITC